MHVFIFIERGGEVTEKWGGIISGQSLPPNWSWQGSRWAEDKQIELIKSWNFSTTNFQIPNIIQISSEIAKFVFPLWHTGPHKIMWYEAGG